MRLLFIFMLFLVVSPISQQELPPLEPITAANADQIELVKALDIGVIYSVFWAEHEEAFYISSGMGIWEYHLNDLTNPRFINIPPIPSNWVPHVHYDKFDGIPPQEDIAISPNGLYRVHRVLSDHDMSSSLEIFDRSTNTLIKTIQADYPRWRDRANDPFNPQFTQNGLVFLREDSLYRWNPATDKEELLIPDTEGQITASLAGNYVITFLYDEWSGLTEPAYVTSLQLWNLTAFPANVILEIDFPRADRWQSVVFSLDGKFVETGGTTANFRRYEIGTGLFTEDYPPYPDGADPSLIVYSPDGKYKAHLGVSGMTNSSWVSLYDTRTDEDIAIINSDRLMSYIAFHPTEDVLVCVDLDGWITFWNIDDVIARREVTSEDAPRTLILPEARLGYVEFNSTGELIAVFDSRYHGAFIVMNYPTGDTILTETYTNSSVVDIDFHPSRNLLAVSEGGRVTLFDLDTDEKISLDAESGNVEFSPDGLILADLSDGISLWDISSLTQITTLRLYEGDTNGAANLAFNRDGTLLAVTYFDKMVLLWGIPRND